MKPVPPAERRARVAAIFDRVADRYDNLGVAWFTPIARRLVRELAPAPGERALDLGTGRGAALFALAEAVGPAGRVTGIDLAPRMVEATRIDVRKRGLTHIDLHVMDAGAPMLPACSYDLAVASFVLFFLPAPVSALRAWRELLVAGGRLGISTFGQTGSGCLDEVFEPYLPAASAMPAGGWGGPFDTDAGVEELMTTAGFNAVRTSIFELKIAFADVDQWYAWSWSHGQRAIWERIPPADRGQVRAAAAELLERSRTQQGPIELTHRIRLTLGERS